MRVVLYLLAAVAIVTVALATSANITIRHGDGDL